MFSVRRVFSGVVQLSQVRSVSNLFEVFPSTFSKPQFVVNERKLRKEYRQLQQQQHPDLTKNEDDTQSSLLNKAYTTLKSPLTRAQYLLKLQGVDLSDETDSQKYSQPDVLFQVLDIHEALESVDKEEELGAFKRENDERIRQSVAQLEELFGSGDYEQAARETVKLKYWVNVDNAIKNWDGSVTVMH
ncbi:J-type chaperone JAC1 [Cyberlindnera jadinii NRRL Y-1542]|uniref:Jac1 co-chaperone n=1 Tax=Cyberlindnera jadinii (strain ATCC 18201 / CBS 1600 / BCRC 20928 / JCM 3617 / NBRC 0987 / NRRL Y-1542) TaxID=983966 RepID=A0A1E4S8S8_CYBJN|nr:Jac1 co-chaperone [Cyberlindnera jadinii NRRL Y-1542]ODV75802.1 Jac1 co-chaperone [Cyberlindnera jadinii NRRL Y-1542]